MKYKASFELVIPTVQFGNAKLLATAEADEGDYKEGDANNLQEQLNKKAMDQVLMLKKELDKLPPATFVTNC